MRRRRGADPTLRVLGPGCNVSWTDEAAREEGGAGREVLLWVCGIVPSRTGCLELGPVYKRSDARVSAVTEV